MSSPGIGLGPLTLWLAWPAASQPGVPGADISLELTTRSGNLAANGQVWLFVKRRTGTRQRHAQLRMRSLNVVRMTWSRTGVVVLSCSFFEAREDAALCRGFPALALQAQRLEFHLEPAQLFNPCGHMPDVLVQQGVDFAAVFLGRILEMEQGPDLDQGHVQRSAMANEGESLNVTFVIHAVVRTAAASLGQQAFALVIPDRLVLRLGQFGQLTDLHQEVLSSIAILLGG